MKLVRIGVPLVAFIAIPVMWVANPLLNLLTFMPLAEGYRDRMGSSFTLTMSASPSRMAS